MTDLACDSGSRITALADALLAEDAAAAAAVVVTASVDDARATASSLTRLLTAVGDEAREEAARTPLGRDPALLPVLVRLLGGSTVKYDGRLPDGGGEGISPRVAVTAAAARALGNIVVDHDENRQRCLELGAVPALVHLLASLVHAASTASTTARAC